MKKILLAIVLIFSGIFLSCSREEPFVAPPPPPEVINAKINEVYSRGTAGNEDWIEIYNPSTDQIDLSGYKIYDSGGQSGSKPKKEIPSGTIIPAGGFFVVVVDDTLDSGFGLSSSGETVWLENASGIIDSITFPALGVDTSYARNPNGSSVWVKLSPPTKGESNSTGGGETQPLVMNEFFSRGADPDFDWIEIYNPNSVQVELTGYKIYDGGGNLGTKPKMEFPVGTVIPANGFYVIVVDTQDPAGFGLGSGGDECWLENSGGTVIDNQVIPAMPVATTSYSRVPDGSTNWLISNTITKGAPNQP
ncbi:MAG: lamin tail domain-containing protein [Ignavibacteriales bacterium]|nr:lamin tail domain-containing protein [Ignavibacteriales bacterium]